LTNGLSEKTAPFSKSALLLPRGFFGVSDKVPSYDFSFLRKEAFGFELKLKTALDLIIVIRRDRPAW
jgi:hypothetical protein